MPGFLSQRSREIDPHLEMRREKRGSSCLWYTLVVSQLETEMSGNFLSCLKGVKDPFEAQEAWWDFSRDATMGKGLISR